MSAKKEEQEVELLKVATQKLQKDESEGDLLANQYKTKKKRI